MERVEKMYQNFMIPEFIELLRCPETGQRLLFEHSVGGAQVESWLISEDRLHRYPIHDDISRFVPESNYADNFGMQWNHFRKTQLESHSGHPIVAL